MSHFLFIFFGTEVGASWWRVTGPGRITELLIFYIRTNGESFSNMSFFDFARPGISNILLIIPDSSKLIKPICYFFFIFKAI